MDFECSLFQMTRLYCKYAPVNSVKTHLSPDGPNRSDVITSDAPPLVSYRVGGPWWRIRDCRIFWQGPRHRLYRERPTQRPTMALMSRLKAFSPGLTQIVSRKVLNIKTILLEQLVRNRKSIFMRGFHVGPKTYRKSYEF